MREGSNSTIPVIRLWDVLVVPIQGELVDHEAEALADDLLARIHREGAVGLVLDLSGVWMMDSHLCTVVVRLSRSARFLGTPTVVTGLSPEVALTLQSMGLDLAAGSTARTLEEALTGFGLVPQRRDEAAEELAIMRRLLKSAATTKSTVGNRTRAG